MLKEERQAYILHQINLHNKVSSASLSEQLDVSEDTVRRDLIDLAQAKQIIKVHGGALSNSFHGRDASDVYQVDKKKKIAAKATTLLQDGMFVLTTGGTTITEFAKQLPRDLQATFITVSLHAALEFTDHPGIEVIFIGDKLSKTSKISVGMDVILKIQQIKADICFIGVNAIDISGGLTDNDWDIVQVKRAMIKNSKKVVALSISEKLDTLEQLKVCDLHEIDMLITELDPTAEKLQPYHGKKIKLL